MKILISVIIDSSNKCKNKHFVVLVINDNGNAWTILLMRYAGDVVEKSKQDIQRRRFLTINSGLYLKG